MDIDIDTGSHIRNKNFNTLKKYFESIGGTCVRVATFKTETAKSAVKTACKGKKINNDISAYLSSLIPVERGNVRCIHDVYYGNEEDDIKPIKEFVNIVDSYSDVNLLQTMLDIEGLITGVSSHASGVLCLNRDLEEFSSFMRTPSGELITSFDLHAEESLGLILIGSSKTFLTHKRCA